MALGKLPPGPAHIPSPLGERALESEGDMSKAEFEQQADDCRDQALTYRGKPEALVLLRIAREFDRLASGALDLGKVIPDATAKRIRQTPG